MIIIQGKKGRDKYYYDEVNNFVSDKEGNKIKLYRKFNGLKEFELTYIFDNLFHKLYKIQNDSLNDDIFVVTSIDDIREWTVL